MVGIYPQSYKCLDGLVGNMDWLESTQGRYFAEATKAIALVPLVIALMPLPMF